MDAVFPKARWPLIVGISFVAGMGVFGILLQRTARYYRQQDEYVTVKGLSEREMPADLVIWPVTFVVSDETLAKMQEKMKGSRHAVRQFLVKSGFTEEELSNTPPATREVRESGKADAPPPPLRYEAHAGVLVRTKDVPKAKAALEQCDQLVEQQVLLTRESAPQFLFTGINSIKPAMIGEANRNARTAAEQFAGDSGTRIGRIRHATQGPFEVEDMDASSPDRKKVRVVTTVDFFFE